MGTVRRGGYLEVSNSGRQLCTKIHLREQNKRSDDIEDCSDIYNNNNNKQKKNLHDINLYYV